MLTAVVIIVIDMAGNGNSNRLELTSFTITGTCVGIAVSRLLLALATGARGIVRDESGCAAGNHSGTTMVYPKYALDSGIGACTASSAGCAWPMRVYGSLGWFRATIAAKGD